MRSPERGIQLQRLFCCGLCLGHDVFRVIAAPVFGSKPNIGFSQPDVCRRVIRVFLYRLPEVADGCLEVALYGLLVFYFFQVSVQEKLTAKVVIVCFWTHTMRGRQAPALLSG